MTSWEWKVTLALIRMVLHLRGYYEYKSRTEDAIDKDLLKEALRRSEV